ncbi:chaplin [Streptomyces sp. NPDC052396]|uniref:chaplin n=1 Tax=Streptomyces sp. NPDC052396 TaxID=3365689 RepID=UPI0037D5B928
MNSAKKVALVLAAAGMALGASVANAAADGGGADARGVATNSPGVLSGDVIQIPIQIPINLCGNSIDIVGLLNPTFGNTCINGGIERSEHREVRFHSHQRHEEHGHGGHHGDDD